LLFLLVLFFYFYPTVHLYFLARPTRHCAFIELVTQSTKLYLVFGIAVPRFRVVPRRRCPPTLAILATPAPLCGHPRATVLPVALISQVSWHF
jgi:hypothetical protein